MATGQKTPQLKAVKAQNILEKGKTLELSVKQIKLVRLPSSAAITITVPEHNEQLHSEVMSAAKKVGVVLLENYIYK